MKKLFTLLLLIALPATFNGQPSGLVWTTQSRNSSESMPCGGGDIGLNVWTENNEILFYLSRSGTFDENNTLLKLGRFRMRLTPNPFADEQHFRQELHLNEGYVSIAGKEATVLIWVDVFHPVVHVEVDSKQAVSVDLRYESWRYKDRLVSKAEGQQTSYKWAVPQGLVTIRDSVRADGEGLTFFHRNSGQTVFDVAVAQQGLEAQQDGLYNPLKDLTFGGRLRGNNLTFGGTSQGDFEGTDYRAWHYTSKRPLRRQSFQVFLHTAQASLSAWQTGLAAHEMTSFEADKKATRNWWKAFWKRSFIECNGEAAEAARNYTLFRYMLGCNAYGQWPTKFNGGLFTFTPSFVDAKSPFTPDYRKWGGGTMTAQNQRLVYWPMLKSGDFDLMIPQFDFYLRLLPTAEMRSRIYWNHDGACFTEQMENFGLPNPAEYGFKRPATFDKGMEYNAWLEYEWDTVLEFCRMIQEVGSYSGQDMARYAPLIDSSLRFFDEHYRMLARHRGQKNLDADGKLILYPGSACETYKMAYNPSSTIAALRSVLEACGERHKDMLERIPAIPLRTVNGKEMIAPAVTWARVNNVETPQLYPVFPWRQYGVGQPGLDVARNTYLYDADALKFRSHEGWKQDNIWAACLGLREEAAQLMLKKLADGPHRFPAFWGPGFDWSPDHNWGGSGMIGLQEMLIQEAAGKILLFPAWPATWDVHFKLHASAQTTVEVTLKDGEVVRLDVQPAKRKQDVVICLPE